MMSQDDLKYIESVLQSCVGMALEIGNLELLDELEDAIEIVKFEINQSQKSQE
jgi:hypothetical protein